MSGRPVTVIKTLQNLVRFDTAPLPAYLVALLSAYFIIAYVIVATYTVAYPFQMEWLEGGVMAVVQRVLQGLPVYTKPTLEYPPFMYTPFYYYVTALFTYVFGVSLLAGRMVSLCSTVAICVILYAWMRKEGMKRLFAILAPALFLATYKITGRWFHLVRVDSLCMALTFGGLFVYAFYQTTRTAIIAGVLLTLAFFTKQQAMVMALPPLALGLLSFPRRTLITSVIWLTLVGLFIAIYQYISDGWFILYTFGVPRADSRHYDMIRAFWKYDLWQRVPIVLSLAVVGIVWQFRSQWRKKLFYIGVLGGSLAAALMSRIHNGGYNNVLIPAYTAIMITCVVTVHDAIRNGFIHKNVCFILLAIQMLMLTYYPFAAIPHKAQYRAGKMQLNYIAHLPGEVLIPDMRFMQTTVGKKSYSLVMETFSAEKLIRKRHKRNDFPFTHGQLVKALRQHKFSAIILSYPSDIPEKNAFYRFKEKIPGGNTPYLITGNKNKKPRFVYVPKTDHPKTKS